MFEYARSLAKMKRGDEEQKSAAFFLVFFTQNNTDRFFTPSCVGFFTEIIGQFIPAFLSQFWPAIFMVRPFLIEEYRA